MKQRIFLIALFFAILGHAQIFDPVKWETSVEKLSDTEYYLISKATIEKNWHLYSQNVPEDGPIPTTFSYKNDGQTFKLLGNTIEEEGHTVDDPVFRMKIKFFENKAVFKQKIQVQQAIKSIKGSVEFMVCDDARCLPPNEVDLIFNFEASANNTQSNNNEKTLLNNNNEVNNTLYGIASETISSSNAKCQNEAMSSISDTSKRQSLWGIFGLGFLGGLLALLTPCVFPMIPLTVSFFTKKK